MNEIDPVLHERLDSRLAILPSASAAGLLGAMVRPEFSAYGFLGATIVARLIQKRRNRMAAPRNE